jgi:PAS domain S-box-containing protein
MQGLPGVSPRDPPSRNDWRDLQREVVSEIDRLVQESRAAGLARAGALFSGVTRILEAGEAGIAARRQGRAALRPAARMGYHVTLPEDLFDAATCLHAIEGAAQRVLRGCARAAAELEVHDAAIYVTDPEGRLVFFNTAAAALWGWSPPLGEQRWCGSWRLIRPDGTTLPHADSAMAVSLRERRELRRLWAFAERPDGSRVPFAPYPTPLRSPMGQLHGGVNTLVDISDLP